MPLLPSYRNQSIDLHSKSIDWFLYEGNTGLNSNFSFLFMVMIDLVSVVFSVSDKCDKLMNLSVPSQNKKRDSLYSLLYKH